MLTSRSRHREFRDFEVHPCPVTGEERRPEGYVVRGDGALGLQYGLTHLLEAHGYRFFHPFRGRAPADPARAEVDGSVFDRDYIPEQRVRGLQLHTLHPIEGLSLWMPSPERLVEARAILDWTVRNRGNFVQVMALDNIQTAPDAWRPHMRAVLDEATGAACAWGWASSSSAAATCSTPSSPADTTPQSTATGISISPTRSVSGSGNWNRSGHW